MPKLMQSSVTPFGMFCSNQFPGIELVPVWLDTDLFRQFQRSGYRT
jgi:hypothetical protein